MQNLNSESDLSRAGEEQETVIEKNVQNNRRPENKEAAVTRTNTQLRMSSGVRARESATVKPGGEMHILP